MRKKITLLMLSVFLLSLIIAPASARPNYNVDVYVNGELVFLPDQRAFIDTRANRTYVPLRFVAEALGAQVDWDSVRNTATVKRGGKTVAIALGAGAAYVDGKPVALGTPAKQVNQRTMVPLRFVSEALGEKVRWEPAGKSGRVLIGEGQPSGRHPDLVKLEKIHGVKLVKDEVINTWYYEPPRETTFVNNDKSYLRLGWYEGGWIWTGVAQASILGDVQNIDQLATCWLWSRYHTGKSGPVRVDLSPIRKSLEGFYPKHPKNPEILARAEKIAAEYMASNGGKQESAVFFNMGDGRRVLLQSGDFNFVSLAIVYPD